LLLCASTLRILVGTPSPRTRESTMLDLSRIAVTSMFAIVMWIFSNASEHDMASTIYHSRSSPYHIHRPSVSMNTESASAAKRPRLMSDFAQPLRVDVDGRRVRIELLLLKFFLNTSFFTFIQCSYYSQMHLALTKVMSLECLQFVTACV